ncbi:glutathione S-transferase family protein [Phyllobacterium sp. BT25]|uniref:Glutathione S-transferase family protein n=1 Tax=Phyllobacterium pellucidum TaxID=2740464 RepID=A0A849VLJ7_9HYPH|nr:glutathione S-transferase family protein [Phyllobacterium pellucidum]NTS30758.1 glutathione S-transferase family protein [Phyllobacterium pellucidum]
MPALVNGEWVKGDVAASEMKDGAFHREATHFHSWITPDGAPGPSGQPGLPAEPGRYQLFVSYLCPWASRTLIFRSLKGLREIIRMSVAEPAIGENGWTFADPQDAGPKAPPIRDLHQLYTASEPNYTGKVSVPVLWDRKEARIVNNESADIIRILNTAFNELTGDHQDFYPEPLRAEIDRWNGLVYDNVNNGVYRAGFAKSQSAYEDAARSVFKALDKIEAHLADHRYLAGQYLTEADWRLFVTLVRFDAAYHGIFKCNIRRIADYHNLSNYMRELYQWQDVRTTVKIDHIKAGYYSIAHINPTLIVPLGPDQNFDAPHDREHLLGKGIFKGS